MGKQRDLDQAGWTMATKVKNYLEFLKGKRDAAEYSGFDPIWMPDFLFDFQNFLVEWAIRKGKAAIFADCGMGKTPMQLVWAENVIRKSNKSVLIITPLAVSAQTVREGNKFKIECKQSRDGKVYKGINVTNYERLHYFRPDDFAGVVLDESSAIKHFTSKRQKYVTEFLKGMKYRLLCTATAAPNDYIELGTSSEALGQMGRMDMLGMFFKNDENSLHPIWWGSKWRMKKHSEQSFWRWICSWARAIRKPSDLGFDDGEFKLPKLIVNQTIVENPKPKTTKGFIKTLYLAKTLEEQRKERRDTIEVRCEKVCELVSGNKPNIVWCHLNPEGDLLENIIPGAVQVQGSDSDEQKEERFLAFADGQIDTLVTKPKIASFGMNWQHCSRMTFFPSHSFEQYYQSVRRCWRYGQINDVKVDIVTTKSERGVLLNLQRKAKAADEMFSQLISEMKHSLHLKETNEAIHKMEHPKWL